MCNRVCNRSCCCCRCHSCCGCRPVTHHWQYNQPYISGGTTKTTPFINTSGVSATGYPAAQQNPC